MKRIKIVWILFSFLILVNDLFGQVDPFVSTTTSGIYEPLQSSVSVNNGEVWYRNSSYIIDLNFNIVLYGVVYRSIRVEAGGGIKFDDGFQEKMLRVVRSPHTGYYLRDRGTNVSVSPIDYEISGLPGDRIVKIQWSNAGFVQDFILSDPTDFIDFQIWIYEEDSKLEIHFGESQSRPETFGFSQSHMQEDLALNVFFRFDKCASPKTNLFYDGEADNPNYDFFDCGVNYSNVQIPSEGIIYAIKPTTVVCHEDGIVFTSQAQIDGFNFNHPLCRGIEGDLTIRGANITNLNRLQIIEYVGGNVLIEETSLLNTSGFSISPIGGNVTIINNPLLTNIYVGSSTLNGDILVSGNPVLRDLGIFGNLKVLNGNLVVKENPGLERITGFTSLDTVKGNLILENNPELWSINGLDNLKVVERNFIIKDNESFIFDWGHFDLNEVGQNFVIEGCHALRRFTSIWNLSLVGDTLSIVNNSNLSELLGLENLDPFALQFLEVTDNPSLSNCSIGSICKYLKLPNKPSSILNNRDDCETRESLHEVCLLVGVENEVLEAALHIYPNPVSEDIFIEVRDDSVINTVTIYNRLGQKVLSSGKVGKMNVRSLERGLYFVLVRTEKGMATRKIVVE